VTVSFGSLAHALARNQHMETASSRHGGQAAGALGMQFVMTYDRSHLVRVD